MSYEANTAAWRNLTNWMHTWHFDNPLPETLWLVAGENGYRTFADERSAREAFIEDVAEGWRAILFCRTPEALTVVDCGSYEGRLPVGNQHRDILKGRTLNAYLKEAIPNILLHMLGLRSHVHVYADEDMMYADVTVHLDSEFTTETRDVAVRMLGRLTEMLSTRIPGFTGIDIHVLPIEPINPVAAALRARLAGR